jgi:hypothetical protein
MVRTQIQLPEPLYREVQRVARQQEWSIAEVLRRGAEAVTRAYPASDRENARVWKLPPPLTARLLITEPAALRDAIQTDADARLG